MLFQFQASEDILLPEIKMIEFKVILGLLKGPVLG